MPRQGRSFYPEFTRGNENPERFSGEDKHTQVVGSRGRACVEAWCSRAHFATGSANGASANDAVRMANRLIQHRRSACNRQDRWRVTVHLRRAGKPAVTKAEPDVKAEWSRKTEGSNQEFRI